MLYIVFVGFKYFQNRKFKNLIPAVNILLPLIMAVTLNQIVLSGAKTVSAIERAATISLSTNDGSVNQRLRYYQDVLSHLKDNPILGTGLGNWKLVSIDYDKEDIVVMLFHITRIAISSNLELNLDSLVFSF